MKEEESNGTSKFTLEAQASMAQASRRRSRAHGRADPTSWAPQGARAVAPTAAALQPARKVPGLPTLASPVGGARAGRHVCCAARRLRRLRRLRLRPLSL